MEQAWINLADATWTVRAEPSADAFAEVPAELQAQLREGIPATVPGCVHTDLLAVGLIADPYVGTAEADQHWVGRQTWTYSGHFDVAQDSPLLDSEHIDLTCDGLDTVADVYCNGHLLGHSENMHRRNLFSAKSALVAGANVVEVVFAPALEYAERMAALVGERIHVERDPYNLVRKMACNFGWDWGPRVVTAGIWKTIGLRGWNTARVLDAVVRATARQTEEGTWTGHLEVDVQLTGKLRFAAVTVRVTGNDARATVGVVADEWTQASVDVSGIEPWWPHTLGEQPMYDVEILLHSDVAVLDRVHKRTGFRTVALDTTPDADGNGAKFGLVLNGEEIFVRGANWIPDDCFVTRVTPERYRERIQQARDANIDLLRIWGGGIYETEAFYEACDELGMMVWQDFCLACAAYPEEEPFWSEFEAEARDNVMRLSAYPSLVVWNGNNENIWGRVDWDWASKPGGDRTWGAGYYYDLFPRVLAELDPSRPYWHGSPSSGSPDLHPNDPNYGCIHIWDVWNDRDYTGYDDYSPRFVSEFGYQGPATYATWARALDPADRGATTAAMLVHQKAAGGNDKLNAGIAGHLPQPGETVPDFDEWLYLMQLQQANAVRYGIDRWRSLRGRCLGSIVWQLNDCWPVTSWAALDSGTNAAGETVARRKPLWYALRSAYADRLLSLQFEVPIPDSAGVWRLAVVNDGRDAWAPTGTIELRRLTGEVLWSRPWDGLVGARGRIEVGLRSDNPVPIEPDLALVVTAGGAERRVRLLVPDVEAALPAPDFETEVAATPTGAQVTVTAKTFLRSLCIFPDRVDEDAWADSALIDLFPGESHTFAVFGDIAADDLPRLTAAPVLRSLSPAPTPSEAA